MSGRAFPLPQPDGDDPRFSFGLLHDVAQVLQAAGYPKPSGVDLVELNMALFRFLYQSEDLTAEELDRIRADRRQARVQAQRAELHLDLSDELLRDLAVRAGCQAEAAR